MTFTQWNQICRRPGSVLEPGSLVGVNPHRTDEILSGNLGGVYCLSSWTQWRIWYLL